jgi:hypothetical protein
MRNVKAPQGLNQEEMQGLEHSSQQPPAVNATLQTRSAPPWGVSQKTLQWSGEGLGSTQLPRRGSMSLP